MSKLLSDGRSLSGREQNCCFLNTHATQFANVSAISGFDFPDDARGVATVDWDHDGDLDLWVTNRTAPRVRFLRNDYRSAGHHLSLQLQGIDCNRDAVGARVEVYLADPQTPRLIHTLRAGEGYLAQSSKWLHFGLGDAKGIRGVTVSWPGGKRELFRDLQVNQRYLLRQGRGVAVKAAERGSTLLVPRSLATEKSTGAARIVLPARLPMPPMSYRTLEGQTAAVFDASHPGPVLVNLWATWCRPCLEELEQWKSLAAAFEAQGVRVLLLNVDATANSSAPEQEELRQRVRRFETPFTIGLADDHLIRQLDVVQQTLTKRNRPLPVPTSFLIDKEGRLAVVSKGVYDPEYLEVDLQALALPDVRQRDYAVPLTGRWYTDPFPPDLLAIPRAQIEAGELADAFLYLQQHVAPLQGQADTGDSVYESISAENISKAYVEIALRAQAGGPGKLVVEALQAATAASPTEAKGRLALAMVLQTEGRDQDAVKQYQMLLEHHPGDPIASNNLAWLMATSTDAAVRNPLQAVKLAEQVCAQSQRQHPGALDTLAAAYFAAGRKVDAVRTAREAIELLERSGGAEAAAKLRARLQQYEQTL